MAHEQFWVVCFVLNAVFACGFGNESVDYKKALDILLNGSAQDYGRSLSAELEFISFMQEFAREYASQDEMYRRFDYFKNNLDKIDLARTADVGTAQYGFTRFSDRSDEELQMLTGLRVEPVMGTTFESDKASRLQQKSLESLGIIGRDEYTDRSPLHFDWRKRGAITPVKNQLNCGACWAFSAIGAMEAHHFIKTKNLVDLSEQQLVDCDDRDYGCNGGLMEKAFGYIKETGGVVPSTEYKYIGYRNSIHRRHCNISYADETTLVKVVSFESVMGERAMKKYLYEHGPLSIAFNADHIRYYKQGIVDMNEKACSPLGINHGLLAVGYGVEHSTIHGDIPYWIVKNSWGDQWGEKGYFRVRRGKNVCGIAMMSTGVETD